MANDQGAVKAAPKIDERQVEQDATWLGKRLSEPSTYAGLGILLGVFLHFSNADMLAANMQTIGMAIGAIILAVIAIIKPEAKTKRAPLPVPSYKDNAKALIALCIAAGALTFLPHVAHAGVRHGRTATRNVPLPKPRPNKLDNLWDSVKPGKPTVPQVQQNPLLVLQQFTVADLQAALKDAQSQTPPDTTAATCYGALIPFVQSQVQNPLPQGAGVFQALQKARDAKAYLANIQSPTGPLAGLNQACAPLVLDVQNTLLTLGISVGVIANPATAPATLAGLPAAIAAFLNLPKL